MPDIDPVVAAAAQKKPEPVHVAVMDLDNKTVMCPECPDCGSMVDFSEGCIVCKSCGYSKCW